ASRASIRRRSSGASSATPSTYAVRSASSSRAGESVRSSRLRARSGVPSAPSPGAASAASPRSRLMIRSEDVTQALHRVVEVDLGGVLAAIGQLRDLLERQVVEHAELEHELLLRRQLLDRAAQLRAVVAGGQLSGRRIGVD